MWTDWICIVWPSVSYSFSSVIFWGSSVFCPNLAPHQSIHHHLSLCPLVFHLSLAFYPSVYPPPPSTKSSDPWLLPTAHSGMSQWTPVFDEVSEWSVITRTLQEHADTIRSISSFKTTRAHVAKKLRSQYNWHNYKIYNLDALYSNSN